MIDFEKPVIVNRNVKMPRIDGAEDDRMMAETNDPFKKYIICLLHEFGYNYLAWEVLTIELKIIGKKDKYISIPHPASYIRKRTNESQHLEIENKGYAFRLV